MGISLYWILFGLRLSFAFVQAYHNAGSDHWYQPVEDRPVDVITDVINNLGIKILQQYGEHGNVAFSPTGVAFVLAALYEGSGGRGSHQISESVHLPHDRDITRIGFRDIHRRLRTYLNADGFLGGLTLNRENTKLRPEYEDILRFYGFDVGALQGSVNETTLTPDGNATATSTDQPMATDQTTVDMGNDTLNAVTTPANDSSDANGAPGNTVAPLMTNTPNPSSPDGQTTMSSTPATTLMPGDVGASSTTVPPDGNATDNTSPPPLPAGRNAIAQDYTSSGGLPNDASTVSTDLPIDGSTSLTSTAEIGSTDLPGVAGATAIPNVAATNTNRNLANRDSENRVKRRTRRSLRGYFSTYPDEGIWMQDLGIWKSYPTDSKETVSDTTEVPFLINGCDVSTVSATRYVAVLPFAYFPSLHAAVLEFPLDDPRYNILLMMPTDQTDTHRLARDLHGKSLRLLRKHLQPTWVKATIPSFMLRGFVTLTSFLQRLGIIDVFEPRVADLSPMTGDLGVYARDVQQSIGVNIRNYMQPDRTNSRNGLFERAGPVPFTVHHPFLYFIIDAETSATLIAGRIEDPLNSRIL
ncbi:uncharacterized protein [Prorops nasuta]|uniref:uncharacterized protein isoform X2 n=1 Tax=Prorops nasuta TaxID=863751 RepID=UPI0034CD7290